MSAERPIRIANCAGWLWDRFSGLRDALDPVLVARGSSARAWCAPRT